MALQGHPRSRTPWGPRLTHEPQPVQADSFTCILRNGAFSRSSTSTKASRGQKILQTGAPPHPVQLSVTTAFFRLIQPISM